MASHSGVLLYKCKIQIQDKTAEIQVQYIHEHRGDTKVASHRVAPLYIYIQCVQYIQFNV